jgi:plastocyanin
MGSRERVMRIAAGAGIAAALALFGEEAQAQQTLSVQIAVKQRRFEPAEVHVPPGRPILLSIRNFDGAAVEFESVSLRVEKVIPANGQGTIELRPLQPGRYKFFDDFHPEARGTLVVR